MKPKRLFPIGALYACVTLSLSAAVAQAVDAAEARAKPNVLLLIIDDLNTWLLDDPDRYGGRVVAPNLRKLADSGVVFTRAYTASPVCSPSRTAFLSGVRPWQSGLYRNGMDISGSEPLREAISFPQVFRDAGYTLAGYGKIGHGWDVRKAFDDYIPHKRDPAPPGAPLTAVGRGEQDWGPTHLAEEEMNDTTYADAAIARLQEKHDQPFLVACGLFHPHMPWYVPQEYFDLFPPEEVQLPPILEDDLADVPELGRELTRGKSRFVDSVLEHDLHRDAVRAYLATTAYADAQMGRVLDALDASRYRDNTIVVMISDHGFHLGEKHHWQKATLWEQATHCLLMIRAPGVTEAGGACERFVSLQDLYPTMVDLCGLELPAHVEGRSLAPLLENPQADWASTAITALNDRHITIRTERYRYIRYDDEQEELYDCSKDPCEWTNEIDNPDYREALRELRASVPALSEMAAPMPDARGRKAED